MIKISIVVSVWFKFPSQSAALPLSYTLFFIRTKKIGVSSYILRCQGIQHCKMCLVLFAQNLLFNFRKITMYSLIYGKKSFGNAPINDFFSKFKEMNNIYSFILAQNSHKSHQKGKCLTLKGIVSLICSSKINKYKNMMIWEYVLRIWPKLRLDVLIKLCSDKKQSVSPVYSSLRKAPATPGHTAATRNVFPQVSTQKDKPVCVVCLLYCTVLLLYFIILLYDIM